MAPVYFSQALRQSGLLVESPKFSKFLHGMALLYPQSIRNTPHWFLPELPYDRLQPQQSCPAPISWSVKGVGLHARTQSSGQQDGPGWLRKVVGLRGARSGRRGGGNRRPAMSPATLEELADAGDKYAEVRHSSGAVLLTSLVSMSINEYDTV